MRTLLHPILAALALAATATAAHAQLTNGDFELGTTGWTFSGNALVSSQVPVASGTAAVIFTGTSGLGGVVSQTVTTSSGQAYRLTFALGETNGISTSDLIDFPPGDQLRVLVINTTSGTHLANSTFGLDESGASTYVTRTILFTATSSSTLISFNDHSYPGSAGAVLLDNVTLTPVTAFSNPGRYNGTLKITRTFTDTKVTTTRTLPVTGQIWPSGAFALLETNTDTYLTGSVSDDGTAATYGLDEEHSGTSTIKGKNVKITFTYTNSLDDNFFENHIKTTNAFNLTRVGP